MGLEHLDLLLSLRRDDRPPGVMSQPEALRRWLGGERLTGQPEAAAGLSSLPQGLSGGPRRMACLSASASNYDNNRG